MPITYSFKNTHAVDLHRKPETTHLQNAGPSFQISQDHTRTKKTL